ncbi:MAG: VCBS repeat-containing protein [Planctomycetes bacterium]|nr:VCBS repeat-containing protein [Planctomycetota bacterium]
MIRHLLALGLASAFLEGQELLWDYYHPPASATYIATFGDLDLDGYDDLLAVIWGTSTAYFPMIHVLSGADGSALFRQVPFANPENLIGVGDFDLDGYPDYAFSWNNQLGTELVEVWSPHLSRQLFLATQPNCGYLGRILAGRVDLNGDGLPDLIAGRTRPRCSDVLAYDHTGALLYTVPAWNLGMLALDAVAIGDVTGDGCDDFVIGGIELNSVGYGVMALISGRTGTVLRVTFGEQPYDNIGYPLCVAGDIDRDGFLDYATSNYWGSYRSVLNVYSGATGVPLRRWSSTAFPFGDRLIGGLDADLDGLPDVIGSAPGYRNAQPGHDGRTHAFSMRDGQILLHTEPRGLSLFPMYANTIAGMGVQPGNPYPVYALAEQPSPGNWGRIEVWRCSPPGTAVSGAGCSSTGISPSIGIRRVGTSPTQTSRLVLGSAEPGALAWCLMAAANSTSYAGVSLPIALDPFGFAGCQLLVPPTWVGMQVVGSAGPTFGYAGLDLGRPLAPSGLGYAFAAQWLVLDPVTLSHGATWRQQFRLQ